MRHGRHGDRMATGFPTLIAYAVSWTIKAHLHERNEGVDALALDGVLHGHHGGLGALLVLRQRALHLRRPDAVPAHVDHVVHAPCSVPLTAIFNMLRHIDSTGIVTERS